MCQAVSIEGPWLCDEIFDIVPPARLAGPDFFNYAAKLHPELTISINSNIPRPIDKLSGNKSRTEKKSMSDHINVALTHNENHFVISYLSNSVLGPDQLFQKDTFEAYVPRFITIRVV